MGKRDGKIWICWLENDAAKRVGNTNSGISGSLDIKYFVSIELLRTLFSMLLLKVIIYIQYIFLLWNKAQDALCLYVSVADLRLNLNWNFCQHLGAHCKEGKDWDKFHLNHVFNFMDSKLEFVVMPFLLAFIELCWILAKETWWGSGCLTWESNLFEG